MTNLLPIVLIFLGEMMAIGAEIFAARNFSLAANPFGQAFIKSMPFQIAGMMLLISGYMLGLKFYKNIWIVTAISVTSILLLEPFLNYFITRQLPTRGALIGLMFGALGFGAALFL